MLLDLGPQGILNQPAQLYFYSGCIRAVYNSSYIWRRRILQAAGEFVYYQSTNPDVTLPKWMGADYGHWQLVVIEGTTGALNDPQWLGNMFAVGQQNNPPIPGKVNGFFSGNALPVANDIAGQMGPGPQLVLVGHSLGGAVALLVAHRLNAMRPGCVKMVTTFGCPRVGNLEWSLGQPWPVLRWENWEDPICQLPPQQGWITNQVSELTSWGPCQDYYPTGQGWSMTEGGGLQAAGRDNLANAYVGARLNLLLLNFNTNTFAHSTGNYAQRLRYWMGHRLPGGRPLGIDMGLVNLFQRTFGAVDGFNWVAPGDYP